MTIPQPRLVTLAHANHVSYIGYMLRSPKQSAKLEAAHTAFARWRLQMGLTQREAAQLLGLKWRTIQTYERATNPIAPSYAVRVLMELASKRQRWPEPWPE